METVNDLGAFEDLLSDVLHEYGIEFIQTAAPEHRSAADGSVILMTSGGRRELPVEIKRGSRAEILPAMAESLRSRFPEGMVVAQQYINPAMGKRYRNLGVFYVDLAGNAWIRQPGLHIFVDGRKRPTSVPEGVAVPRPMTTSWLRLVFVLMVRPQWAGGSVRELANAAGLSVGATHRALAELTAQGHILQGHARTRTVRRMAELAERWVVGYSARLLPSLESRYWAGPEPSSWLMEGLGSEATIAGEAVDPAIQHPSSTTLFCDPPFVDLVRQARLRPIINPDVQRANVVTRTRFWNEEALQMGQVAHPMLTCGELLASSDERLREVGSARLADITRGLP